MSKIVKMFLVCMLFTAVSTSALAYDVREHVRLAGDGRGDVIIFPVYVAFPGWNTNITVINTHHTYSVVAKVVFRSQRYTEELLDFLIFLSPEDVWDGTVRVGDNGKVQIFSDDDSVRRDLGVFASKSTPWVQDLFPVDCNGDTENIGYIEVFEAWAGNIGEIATAAWPAACPLPPAQPNLGSKGTQQGGVFVDKRQIECFYRSFNRAIGTPLVADGRQDETVNSLTGFMEISAPSSGISAAITPTILKNYNNREYLDHMNPTTFNNAGAMFNTITEVEAALAVEELHMPYEPDITVHIITFPTKQAKPHNTLNPGTGNCRYRARRAGENFPQNLQSPFWQQNGIRGDVNTVAADPLFDSSGTFSARVSVDPFDMLETHVGPTGIVSGGVIPQRAFSLIDEVNLINLGNKKGAYYNSQIDVYDQGWVRYVFSTAGNARVNTTAARVNLNRPDIINFTGAPAIGTVFSLEGRDNAYMLNAAVDFGIIRYSADGGATFGGQWTNGTVALPLFEDATAGYPFGYDERSYAPGMTYTYTDPVLDYHLNE